MKSINFFFVCMIALVFTACSNAESDGFEDNSSSFESMKSLYGIETAAYDQPENDVPSVSTEEMGSVLEALRMNSAVNQACKVEDIKGHYGAGSDKKTVMMTAEYQARTRSGAFVENFALCVSLNFVDNDGLYYSGTTYECTSDLFFWKGNSASMTTTPEEGSVFSSTSSLYFRVSDQGNCLVKVPVVFKGSYDFAANKGVYSFTLSKAAR